jgi:aspartate aminotransferase-like enzyme
MDDWGVDVAIAGGQKGLMLPTGLGIAAVGSARAWGAVEKSRLPKYYFDWKAARVAAGRHETAWSAPASLVRGLRKSIDMLLEEGLENVTSRHARLAESCRGAVKELGLKLLAPEAPADGVTGFWAPEGISGAELKKLMSDKYGVDVAGGQQKLKGKIIRIGHLGYVDGFDIIITISALEMALKDLGYPVKIGSGVSAAERALAGK